MALDCVQRQVLVLAVLKLSSNEEFFICLVKFMVTRFVHSHVIFVCGVFKFCINWTRLRSFIKPGGLRTLSYKEMRKRRSCYIFGTTKK